MTQRELADRVEIEAATDLPLRVRPMPNAETLVRALQNAPAEASMRNPLREPIFDAIAKGDPWLALSWRHYIWWFADFEKRFARGDIDPRFVLQQAENNWLLLQDRDELFKEPRNNGSWIRPWR